MSSRPNSPHNGLPEMLDRLRIVDDGGNVSDAVDTSSAPFVGASAGGSEGSVHSPTFVRAGASPVFPGVASGSIRAPCSVCVFARPRKRERSDAPEGWKASPLVCPACGRTLSPV
ncbi:hypothetical protein JCM10213v2_007766 [Rhodosporidiobolus nylandii]